MSPLRRHLGLIALVLLVALGEVQSHWSRWLLAPLHDSAVMLMPAPTGQVVGTTMLRYAALPHEVIDPLVPAVSQPLAVTDAFRTLHLLAEAETLGDLAERYGVSLASLIWANGLDRGDALMLGQPLRIPRVSGVVYVVRPGDDVASLAARMAVAPEALLTFGPNRLADAQDLAVGMEIFVPGGVLPLDEHLLTTLAQRGAEPVGVVQVDEANLRQGPGTEYDRQIKLERGRQVGLRARHADWLKVEIAGTTGWIRSDLLHVSPELVESLPETNDFPPPPPRWVWPARGTLTSPFGPRWGSFHNGIDIANRAWTPIVAARAGWVREAGWCRGYGYCVKIRHSGGVETIYGHLVAQPDVAAGDEVTVGQYLGGMGSTYDRAGGGYSTGVHLHFTVLVNGRAVNPLSVLP
ncbi:peptidoglycan DD-metalloendopeptidase family protein [Candidatus Oscillochloris fontis]|uniref:peptidoglycan DD-metalloendopeptidase family protein n=1 Tax=Candidatus Oscillochloris fontis TaxID=2496868 RepID=UPI001EE95C27|nr:peptidoglycan DD-metalloendopeptidase family protein [Candidatus Oscillochloris fontis]